MENKMKIPWCYSMPWIYWMIFLGALNIIFAITRNDLFSLAHLILSIICLSFAWRDYRERQILLRGGEASTDDNNKTKP